MIPKTRFAGTVLFKAISSILQVPFPLKYLFDLIILNKFQDCINDINIGLFGSILKSPRTTWL